MNIVLVVVDSLRARSLRPGTPDRPRTPFLDRLAHDTVTFSRAYSSECWTLPAHMSMFTGLLPSEHGAHFQTMAYRRPAPTIAELLAAAGYHTEVITRNSLFDDTVPGATRGFATNTRLLADLRVGVTPFALVLALAKPRVRRLIEASGFFSALQKRNREFIVTLLRLGIPADVLVLNRALDVMGRCRRNRRPYFLFVNLYDVHAPYSPSPRSPMRSWATPRGWAENLRLPWVLPKISSHAYLRPGFRLSDANRRMLLGRYHRAIELMDGKVEAFFAAARGAGLLDDTLVVLTSDHGEAFGDHGLYLHDASVYDTHLHVPLWIHHPALAPARVDDVVTTRDLHALFRAVGLREGLKGTMLDPHACAAYPVALAEHFHYPYTNGLLPRYCQNVAAAVVGHRKAVLQAGATLQYDLSADPDEEAPTSSTLAAFEADCRRDGAPRSAIAAALEHLQRWQFAAAA